MVGLEGIPVKKLSHVERRRVKDLIGSATEGAMTVVRDIVNSAVERAKNNGNGAKSKKQSRRGETHRKNLARQQ